MRYDVTEKKGFNDVRVFSVTPIRAIAGRGQSIDVWLDSRCSRCTNCSGPLSAMLSSCAHAAAVKRHVAKQKAAST